MSLASAALKRPVTTVAATLAFVLLGAVSLGKLPVSLLPDVSLPVLTIRTGYAGSAASEVSRFIAEPIEQAVAATPGLVDLRSVSRNGESVTTLRFSWGTDMATTVLQVRERLDNARGNLPERADRPTLLTSDPGERPIAVLGLTGPGDLRSIARTATEVHARRLEQLAGVSSVAVVGDPKDEIRVDVNPEKARALGITSDDVARAVRDANASAPGGTVRRGQFRFALRALTEFQEVDEVVHTPVGPDRAGITLGDIGTVALGAADPVTMTRLDGAPAVGMVVYKDNGANTVAVTREIYQTIEVLAAEFPEVKIRVVAAQAQFVSDALSNLGQEIVLGGILSLLVIVLFLRDLRGSIAIALIIPLSVLTALTLLQFLGVTINILSLGGLALGIGLLVDNAIVVAEATGRYKEQGLPDVDAARRATEEVSAPLIAGTLTTVMVFGPIVFVQGLAAALFRDLSLSVVVTLMTALVLALTLMPVLMVRWRQRGQRSVISDQGETTRPLTTDHSSLTRWGTTIADRYEAGMKWCLLHPRSVFLTAAVVTVITVLITLRLPREVLPRVDERTAVAQLALPQGTSIEETARQTARLESAARELGSSGVYARIGNATDEEVLAGADPGTSATAQLIIPVPDAQNAGRFADSLRARVPDLAQGALSIDLAGQSEFGSLIGREGRLVRVEVSAPRLDEAARWADSVRRLLVPVRTLADVRDAFSTTQPTIEVTLERTRIAQYGISVEQVGNALAGALGGVASGEFRETDRRTPITVRFAGDANEDLTSALASQINGIPVGQLVSVREIRAPVEVVRMNQRPVSVVEGVVERGGTARATRDVSAAISALAPPPGVTWQIGGADAEQRRTTRELALVALLSAALVYLVLAGEFGSFSVPLLVMLTVPLAAAGGLIFLWLTGQSLNAVSLIGLVVMIGMADNEAVVKLDAIRRFREQGHSVEEAVLLGGRQRLRAIAMTSITTITGVLPLVFGWGSGGALYQPLAAGVIGGSISALAVTFFLLPTAYAVMERRKGATAQRRNEAAARAREVPA
ncbi:MAG TPA: efflux RND transporter permease subunit [Gemmatimonadales bacterium]|nr:efflux RND transporter permease subunit [Gemmatimonadales bacterium]